jgi:hypothetical protein
VSAGELSHVDDALGLYVYGRLDTKTNQLENSIIVEGRREQLRLVSVDALLDLLALKQEYGLAHNIILSLFLPAPVKVDFLANLISDIVAQEKEEEEEILDVSDKEEEKRTYRIATEETTSDEDHKLVSNLVAIDDSYTGMTAESIRLFGRRYAVHTWKAAALQVFEVLLQKDPKTFVEQAVTIRGRKRPYVTPDPDELRSPAPIPTTDLYFEANLSANFLVKLCYTLLEKMGFSQSDLQFETAK